jgi:hypothetical protein
VEFIHEADFVEIGTGAGRSGRARLYTIACYTCACPTSERLRNFHESLSRLPCWVDGNLSTTVFGPKQNLDFWDKVFQSGKAQQTSRQTMIPSRPPGPQTQTKSSPLSDEGTKC